MVSEARELAGTIVDEFEDFLTDVGETVPNKDRDEELAEAETQQEKDTVALLYGDQYYDLEDCVTHHIKKDYNDICSDLMKLCEDNTVLKASIAEYFVKRKKEDVEGYDDD